MNPLTLDPYPWLHYDPIGGPACRHCGHLIVDADDPYEHNPDCPVGPNAQQAQR